MPRLSPAILAVLLSAILAACSAPLSSAPTSSPSPQALTQIKVAYSGTSTSYSPLWVAQDIGFLRQNGLDAGDLVATRGGTQTAQALIAGDVQFAYMSPGAIVEADAAGADAVCVAGMVTTLLSDFVVQPNIASPQDLRGKKLAVSGPTGDSVTATRYVVKTVFNLDPDHDVTLVSIGTEPERLAALESKQVDGSIIGPEFEPQAQRAGLTILAKLWQQNIPYQAEAIITTRAFAKKNPDTIRAFLRAMVQAIAFYKAPANEEKVKQILGKYLKETDPDRLEIAYSAMAQHVLQRAPYVNAPALGLVIATSKQATAKGLKPEDIMDNSTIQDLDRSGFIESLYK